jgi:hypothetical protein
MSDNQSKGKKNRKWHRNVRRYGKFAGQQKTHKNPGSNQTQTIITLTADHVTVVPSEHYRNARGEDVFTFPLFRNLSRENLIKILCRCR